MTEILDLVETGQAQIPSGLGRSKGIRLIQTGNIGVGSYREQGFRYITNDTFRDFGCTQVNPGDVLICRLGDPVGRACLAPPLSEPMITSVDVCILKPRVEFVPEYLVYAMSSPQYLGWVSSLVRGSTRDGVSRSMLGSFLVPSPPKVEQAAIVRLLDHVDRRIRRYIRAKKKLIALLNEEKQAIINRAVTRGLDQSVRLKPSGVEWLGDVPEHWEVRRLKEVTTPIEQGWSPQCDAQPAAGDEWGVLKVGCVNRDVFDAAQNKKLPPTLQPVPTLEIRDGDILVSRANTRELLGLAAFAANPRPRLMLCDKLFRFRAAPNQADSRFLVFAIRGKTSRAQIESSTNGASDSMQNIGQGVVRNLVVSLPPIDEQQRVVATLADQTGSLARAISQAERQIALVREYRTRLIADVVTGKLDVREAAANLPDEPEEPDALEEPDVLEENGEDAEAPDIDATIEENGP